MGSEWRKIIAMTRNQHMRNVHPPFFFSSFPSQFTSPQSFSALNNRARHPLKVLQSSSQILKHLCDFPLPQC